MPQQEQPIKQRPKVEDESTGEQEPRERHGKHREGDEGLAGKGSTKGGLNERSGQSGEKQGTPPPPGEREERE